MKLRSLLAALTLCTLLALPAQAHPSKAMRSCRFGPTWTHQAVRSTIACAERHWPTPGGLRTAECIAEAESGLTATARNPSGSSGIYQILVPSTWNAWHWRMPLWNRWYGVGGNVFQARNNILTAIRVMHNSWTLAPWAGDPCVG